MRQIHAKLAGCEGMFFIMNVGESQPEHNHTFVHGHKVIRGRTRVTVGDKTYERTEADGNMQLPAVIPHSVMALEPLTMYINTCHPDEAADGIAFDAARFIPKDGGVLTHDGEVVY